MENPVEVLYCWQALLVAITAAGLTQLVKAAYDTYIGRVIHKRVSLSPPSMEDGASATKKPKLRQSMKVGKSVRQDSPVVNTLIFPAVPVVLGALIGALVPMHPDVLIDFMEHRNVGFWPQTAMYAMWGGACGQFADYAFTKAKDVMRAFVDSKAAAATEE